MCPWARPRLRVVAVVVIIVGPEQGVLGALQDAPRLVLGAALGHVLHQLRHVSPPDSVEIEPVHGLGEAQVGVDARDDDARIDGEDLDPDQRDPDEDIDDKALIEDQVEDLVQAARSRPLYVTTACPSHCSSHCYPSL